MEMNRCTPNVFPPEIYENILKYLDGFTLLQAEFVCQQWQSIVRYLGKKTNIWKQCCHSDLSENTLYCMIDKYGGAEDKNKWEIIFRNWFMWLNIRELPYTVVKSEDCSQWEGVLQCAKMSGSRIVIGHETGYLTLLDEQYTFLDNFVTNIQTAIENLHFLYEKPSYDGNTGFKHTHLLVMYDRSVALLSLEPKFFAMIYFRNVIHFCAYGEYFCYMRNNQSNIEIVVQKFLRFGNVSSTLQSVAQCQLFAPTTVASLSIYQNLVTIVTDSNLMTFDYSFEIPLCRAQTGQLLPFPHSLVNRYWVFYNEVVFCTAQEYLHYTTVKYNNEDIVTKKFNCMEILGSLVCDILLHGDILILCMANGTVFIYVTKDWSEFDIRDYDKKIFTHMDQILAVDVQELKDMHKLLLTMCDCIVHVYLGK